MNSNIWYEIVNKEGKYVLPYCCATLNTAYQEIEKLHKIHEETLYIQKINIVRAIKPPVRE